MIEQITPIFSLTFWVLLITVVVILSLLCSGVREDLDKINEEIKRINKKLENNIRNIDYIEPRIERVTDHMLSFEQRVRDVEFGISVEERVKQILQEKEIERILNNTDIEILRNTDIENQ